MTKKEEKIDAYIVKDEKNNFDYVQMVKNNKSILLFSDNVLYLYDSDTEKNVAYKINLNKMTIKKIGEGFANV